MDKQDELRRQRQALKEEMEAGDHKDLERSGSAAFSARSPVGGAENRLSERLPSGPDLSMVMDIPVRLTLEVGGSDMPIRDLLQLHQGAIVELDRQAGEPLDVLVNGTLIARGEVVVIEDKLGIRLTEVVSQADRLQSLS
ncbi:Flagellar motor switch protein FliN [Zhongshania aliphaticivorans]|uniref:Flagellar motor switch protein FliN n=1 Tax=Zhongshania aliphaticivorans TaxID=1470434 RepID=A0A5S9QCC3_9GAMM|nr:flagellar motor switch protein FliN [Zhongshania aliphaticivorans]CAA0087755.1 Flagellar motor switch protein FliN [Zhongshania aliphaticivorans]CAA0115415.1 Flagellar motor switch protein FliN [Zhongshania aliphaticivorans]CAA0120208.1 Flagellar motor switch protein FliN [Zhongshania aliphaticivorans]